MGILGGGNSKAKTTTTTENQDKRIVADSGSSVLSADRSNMFDLKAGGQVINLNSTASGKKSKTSTVLNVTDGGAVRAALDFAHSTVDTVAGDGMSRLLSVAQDIFETSIKAQGDAVSQVQAAYAQADANKSGAIDNRTMIVLAVVAGVALVIVMRAKK